MSGREKLCVIGLCGRSGAGKSFVSRIFEEIGVPTVDTDALYREMTGASGDGEMSACMGALVDAFGEGILSPDNSLDRRALAGIVFAPDGEEKRTLLNRITHKFILDEADRRLALYAKEGAWAAIVDAPLLFESGYHEKCDFIIAAVAPEEVLLQRIVKRDEISVKAALDRLAVQLSDKDVRDRSDFIIDTDTDKEALSVRIREIASAIKAQWRKANEYEI